MSLHLFHSSVSKWFREYFSEPTDVQSGAWPEIKKRQSTLIAAPTGSGKTLAAFLSAIDDLIRLGCENALEEKTYVVYVSPLKALSNDIERNLQFPLKGISEELKKSGHPEVKIKVGVRTGDTTPSERTGMIKNPPHILVTTPESLYLLLTSVNGRKMLSSVQTVIVDEIHAVVGSKRGSHLSLSLERLQHLTKHTLTRIGISATQKPIEKVAAFLMGGNGEAERSCKIIDTGHRRKMNLALEVPPSPLTAVMSHEVWGEIYNRLEDLINQHKTTLIFVNTRRLAERLAHHLTEKLGAEAVTAHHGSMSKEHRFDAEQRLKAGSLKALVATASLELGIDIGSVDLVCQIGSPRSIAAFLQRVGRSGHSVGGTPKGIIYPLTRDELVECTAILDAVRRGELDEIIMPEKPIDVLAQQIVAEVGSDEWEEDALYNLMRRAYPYRDLSRKEFDEVISMLAEGFTTRRGRRAAYIFHDIVNKIVKPRKGSRLTALINGGSIPDNFDYDVVQEPENIFIGTLNEDFAIESLPGDIFQLGNSSYQILRVENGKVRVANAKGQPPSLPFWLGEAPGRTAELSVAVARLREEVSERLGDLSDLKPQEEDSENAGRAAWKISAMDWLMNEVKIEEAAADQLVTYLATAKAALEILPSQKKLVLERFFDEAGDMHLVVHSPFGARLNRGWGLSLRKRFCKKFNFELQAAATEDAIILSLGSTHSFPLKEVFNYLKSRSVREILVQALLDSPMFGVRWRWNASCALAIQRRKAGQRVAPQLQRMQAEDLVALVFPDQLACFENIQGEREVPDHPLVNQTIHDCLTEAMDIDELEKLLKQIEGGEVELYARDLREPSPLAQEILNARPYAFLDDAPLEERRTRAVINRRWLDPSEAKDLGKLDEQAIINVKAEAWPEAENADEFQDALSMAGYFTKEEVWKDGGINLWNVFFNELRNQGRVTSVSVNDKKELWISVDRIPQFNAVFPDLKLTAPFPLPAKLLEKQWGKEEALREIIRGRMEILGPVTEKELAESIGLPVSEIHQALLMLEGEGFVFRGNFTPDTSEEEWCERRLLARIHRYTLERLRKEIEAVSTADFMRYLFQWHGITEKQSEGPRALEEILKTLEGFEAAASAWESDILPLRMKDYDYQWLDNCCLSGKTVWGRFRVNKGAEKKSITPVKTTPIMLVTRGNLSLWKEWSDIQKDSFELSHAATKVYDFLASKGASFFEEIFIGAKLLKVQVEEGISELVSAGLITSDSFTGVRALLVPSKYKLNSVRRKTVAFKMEEAGRWSLLNPNHAAENGDSNVLIETIAKLLLNRYGVVFRKLADTETISPPWRDIVKVYRKMEARGEIRGGRFVDGVWGEQFALPDAVASLRQIRKEAKTGNLISISASDPLNLHGVLGPGKKISSFPGNRVLYRDGVVVAVQEGGEVKYFSEVEGAEKWDMHKTLVQRKISPNLRAYLGKGIN
ncbi:MAG: DEAD/DEAH box helicase [Cytophagaceae bacterium]|nr:DEAD/DEAH box helicase [Cytophagaceae bacterium]